MSLSSTFHMISPIYLFLFLVLVGFIYHLIRNNEYKDTLLASIIIGFILGLIFNTNLDLVKTVIGDLISIILVILGGFISVGLKKLVDDSTEEQYDVSNAKTIEKLKLWDKQNPKFSAIIIIIICFLSLILIISPYSLSNPVKDPVQLTLSYDLNSSDIELEDTLNDRYGNVIIISNNTTKFKVRGSSEPNTIVKITVNELGIYNQTVQLNPNNNFSYNLSIPPSVKMVNITAEASKPGKDNTIVTLYLKR